MSFYFTFATVRYIQGEQIDWFSQSLSDIDLSINMDSEGRTFKFLEGKGIETNKIFICVFEKG